MHTGDRIDSDPGIKDVLDFFEQEYYSGLEARCNEVKRGIAGLNNDEENPARSLYAKLSDQLVGKISGYIQLRRAVLVPYIHELLEKEKDGHDCLGCNGPCKIRHASQLDSMRDAHSAIQATLQQLESIDPAAAPEREREKTHQDLHRAIAQLTLVLTELLQMEASHLIPMVQDAQNAIHARS